MFELQFYRSLRSKDMKRWRSGDEVSKPNRPIDNVPVRGMPFKSQSNTSNVPRYARTFIPVFPDGKVRMSRPCL
jgi:hypothetical protein